MPQPPDTSHWDEYDWEQYLRESDRYAAQFFDLLKRFSDLPGARQLIATKLGKEFKGKMLNCNFDCENCESRQLCEFSNFIAPEDEAEPPYEEEWEEEGAEGEGEEERQLPQPGDQLFYETDPGFVMLRQTAIGWCNIYAAILPPDARPLGLKILFHIGRALANLAYSISDGTYQQPAASIALAKRSLSQLNLAIGRLAQLIQEKPRLAKLLGAMKGHLLQCQEAIGNHLRRSRGYLQQQQGRSTPDGE
ncbi:MAG: hypothetical protein WC789_00700 [Lentisphaeria bacterium]|jgi:hypothetical protein